MFFFEVYGDHRDLHVLTHSFPTRRSSDLLPSGVTLSDSGAGYAIFNVETLNGVGIVDRSEEHTSELQSLMRSSYAVFCLKKKRIDGYRCALPILRKLSQCEQRGMTDERNTAAAAKRAVRTIEPSHR